MRSVVSGLLIVGVLGFSGCWEVGRGEKIGRITKLAKTGLFCKTWEAEIVRGGLNGGTGVMGRPFDFTIADDDLVKQIQTALDQQQEIKIFYRTEAVTCCRSDSDDHFLTKVEIVQDSAPPVPVADRNQSAGSKMILQCVPVESK